MIDDDDDDDAEAEDNHLLIILLLDDHSLSYFSLMPVVAQEGIGLIS